MDRTDILRALMPERTKQIALAWSILRQSHLSEDAYQDMLALVFENDSTFARISQIGHSPTVGCRPLPGSGLVLF